MGFYVLFLNCELPPTRATTLLGRLFAIGAGSVLPLLSDSSSELYYKFRILPRAKTPRSDNPASCFFVELCVYPHGQLAAVYDSELAFARAFTRESQLPVIIFDQDKRDPYCWLLLEREAYYEVAEWPEDEETVAITVTDENKKKLSA